ncbi:L,D-transpeptidase family protein [Moraxella oblonga]|uniref:L,D-transpeptidase family protein n=1 Tax=Moraxella oblonga TaxID=200413 RepID=UPI000832BF9F|nr:L,D-transpeptidase family protein [Moraxella oblonga]
MKKFAMLSIFAILIVSTFAFKFQQAPNNPASISATNDIKKPLPTLSPRQIKLVNQPPLLPNTQIDKLVVYKSKREMHAFYDDKLIKIYPIALGQNPIGHKEFEGDMKTPEGIYTINDRNANSSFHKNLGISYPNEADIAHAKTHGKSAGGAIKIHGIKNGLGDLIGANHLLKDWTHGCIAVTNPEIDELFVAVVDNAVIEILP